MNVIMAPAATQRQENASVHQGGKDTTVPNTARKNFGVMIAVWPVTVSMVVPVILLQENADVHMASLAINASLFVPWASSEKNATKGANVDLVNLVTM